jgi:hypothetical protein
MELACEKYLHAVRASTCDVQGASTRLNSDNVSGPTKSGLLNEHVVSLSAMFALWLKLSRLRKAIIVPGLINVTIMIIWLIVVTATPLGDDLWPRIDYWPVT